MSHSTQMTVAAFDLAAMTRALEHSDADTIVSLYEDDAEMEIVDRDRPPSTPMRLVGRPAIEAFWRDVCSRQMTHAVGETISDAHRAAFVERCAYPDGCHVVSAVTLELHDGRIRRQLMVQAWDEASRG